MEDFVEIEPGLKKRILKAGKGPQPTSGATVTVHYTGTLLDGTKFDSSRDRKDPFQFKLGQRQVIKGWEVGIATMCVGEVCDLLCEPEYAYGKRGSPPKIPENSTLLFNVEMLDFSRDPQNSEEKYEFAMKKKDLGANAFAKGDFENAIKFYESGLELIKKPWDIEKKKDFDELKLKLQSNLTMCYLKIEDFRKVLDLSEKILVSYPLNPKAMFRRAVAFKKLGLYSEAFDWIKKAVMQVPKDPTVHQEYRDIRFNHECTSKSLAGVYSKMMK